MIQPPYQNQLYGNALSERCASKSLTSCRAFCLQGAAQEIFDILVILAVNVPFTVCIGPIHVTAITVMLGDIEFVPWVADVMISCFEVCLTEWFEANNLAAILQIQKFVSQSIHEGGVECLVVDQHEIGTFEDIVNLGCGQKIAMY